MPKVKALKSFSGEEGFVKAGQEITISSNRHAALAANGLVPKPKKAGMPEPAEKVSGLTNGSVTRRSRKLTG